MIEAQFQAKVLHFLKDQGAYVIKQWGGGRFTRAGVPDITCCINGYYVALELKTEIGRTSKLQDWNIEQIKQAGGVAMVLRPNQFEVFKSFVREVKRCPKPNIHTPG